jgi:hypothetical protein
MNQPANFSIAADAQGRPRFRRSHSILAIILLLGTPAVAEELPRREWTLQMCEETATPKPNVPGQDWRLGCYGLTGKRMDVFDACYAHPIEFSKSCSYGVTPPLAFAVRHLDIATIDRLILKGADANAIVDTGWGKGSLMMIAAQACRDHETLTADCAVTLRRLVELGVDSNGIAGSDTPLIVAAHGRNVELMKMLLVAGAEINRKGRYGHTAWDHARMPGGSRRVADYLQSRGGTGDSLLQIKQKLLELMWPPGQH